MKNNFSKNKPLIIKSLLGLAVVATAVNTAILLKTKQEVAELQIAVDNIDIPKIKNSTELNQFFKSYILASGYDKVLKKQNQMWERLAKRMTNYPRTMIKKKFHPATILRE